MALALLTTTSFEKDLKRVTRQGKDLDKLENIVTLLSQEQALPARCRPHVLRGNWSGHWDCGLAIALQTDHHGIDTGPEVTGNCLTKIASTTRDKSAPVSRRPR